MEQVTVRRLDRPQRHFTLTSNVLLFGYRQLSDGEKLTYLAVQSFDWANGDGRRKGFAFPSIETLATRRGLDRRTIFRHLDKLERVGLVRREVRAGRPTLLHLEGPSALETKTYLATVEKGSSDTSVTRDTDVTPTHDTGVTPYKKDKEETDKPVNEFESVLQERSFVETDSGWKRYQPKSKLSREQRFKRDYIAGEILKVTKDPHSLGYYRKVAGTIADAGLFAAISEVRHAARSGRIRTSKGRMFTAIANSLQRGGGQFTR